ncbi:MAG: sulfur carrier protein ThiS [Planctomycetes bacterium]|jgi:thiamine biosynthesis protein ThiS|nr:sulfur carrier protein ThiS [Planctomycetota bacterium]
MKSIQVNGQGRQFPPEDMPATLSALLERLGIGAATVVAEVDGQIVTPEQFAQTQIREGQTIELVKFMGGG